MASYRAGGKIARSHGTLIDSAKPIVDMLDRHTDVSKIVISIIRSGGLGRGFDIKFFPILAGLRLVVKGNRSIQEIYLYTKKPKKVERDLRERFLE